MDRTPTRQCLEVWVAAAVLRVLRSPNCLGDIGFDVAAGGTDCRWDRAAAGAGVFAAVLPGIGRAHGIVASRFRLNDFRNPGAAGPIYQLHAGPGWDRGSDHRYRY